MILFLAAAVTFHANFEGAALGPVERVAPAHFRCPVPGQSDQDNRNRQASWYYFRVEGAQPGKALTIDLTALLGEYNYKPGTHAVTRHTRPLISYDNRSWTHLSDTEAIWEEKEPLLRLRITPQAPKFWIAHTPPYTGTHLAELEKQVRSHPAVRIETVGKTVEGRPMPLWTITEPGGNQIKKSAWLMFRQHAWESGSSWVGDALIRWLLSAAPESERLRRDLVWKIFPLADPDGVARGGVRFNRNGYDLNRNWDLVIPEKMPEIAAQKKALYAWIDAGRTADLFLTLHNTESSEYLDGPPLPLGERLFNILKQETIFHPSRPYGVMNQSTTPGKPGRMNVAQALWHERKIPAFVMENRVEHNARLGRLPTIDDRQLFGKQLAEAIAKALAMPE